MTGFPDIYLNFHFNGESLVGILAKEGKNAHVSEILTSHPEHKKNAAYGYAMAQNDAAVDKLIGEDVNLAPHAVAGYARAGFVDKVRALINKFPDLQERSKQQAVYGYAQAGNLLQIASALRSANYYLPLAIQGSASTNQKSLLMGLLQGTQYYSKAIIEAAKNGHTDLVTELLSQFGIKYNEPFQETSEANSLAQASLLHAALSGYMQGSHFSAVAHLITMQVNPMFALEVLEDPADGIKKEDAMVLLSHIPEKLFRDRVFNLIFCCNLSTAVFDVELIDKMSACMKNGANYFEAAKMHRPEHAEDIIDCTGPITLSMLKGLITKTDEHVSAVSCGR